MPNGLLVLLILIFAAPLFIVFLGDFLIEWKFKKQ